MPHFELCAESLASALTAQTGGADRVELCAQLAVSGITPDLATTQAAVKALTIPVHVLIRPRAGNFVYTEEELALIKQQIQEAKAAGAAGVVIGILHPNGRIDIERTHELATLAAPMHITFHRAFDETSSLPQALEDVIATGAHTLLTSGGQPTAIAGATQIAALHQQAAGRIAIMAGSGLTPGNIAHFAQTTGVPWLHGSLLRKPSAGATAGAPCLAPETWDLPQQAAMPSSQQTQPTTAPSQLQIEDVREVTSQLHA
jgi:copper homeostasis protein